MAGFAKPGAKPIPKPPAPGVPTGTYQSTVGGQTYVPSPEEQAQIDAQAARTRQTNQEDYARNTEAERYASETAAAKWQLEQERNRADARFALQRSDIKGLESLIGAGSGSGYTGGPVGGSGGSGGSGGGGGAAYSPAADAATYGRAKENTGLAMKSAIKGLEEDMVRRGMPTEGNGLLAKGLTDIYDAGLGDLAETDRQLAEGTAGRGFQSAEAAAQRSWQSSENAAARAAAQTNSQLDALLRLYGMVY